MSNSSLVSYTRISPNRNSPRTHSIDTITIHCMAGNLSVETCGDVFANKARKASSNYGIGTDGRIAMYCEEKDRSWCSSNPTNDDRAITIEVANDGGAPDWHVSDKAISSLIKLVTDICQRNNIKQLVWSSSKSDRVNHRNGCNMTVHRDYAAKACPGDYLYYKHEWIASEVNKRLNGGTPTPAPTPTPTPGSANVIYKVRSNGRWLPEVTNLKDYAGIEQVGITGFMVKLSDGTPVKYRVHIKGGNWLPYVTGYSTNDSNNGYAGNGRLIDAIEINCDKYSIKYRTSPVGNKNYYSWQVDNNKGSGMDGYAGAFGKAVDKVQCTIS